MKISERDMRTLRRAKPQETVEAMRRVEILGVMLIYLGIMLMLGLLSHHPEEQPGKVSFGSARNLLGLAGAYVSHFLFRYTIGYPSVVLPLLSILWGWVLFRHQPAGAARRWSVHILALAFYASILLALPEVAVQDGDFHAGEMAGALGLAMAKLLVGLLGLTGCVIFLTAVMMVMVISATQVSLGEAVGRLGERARGWWQQFRRRQVVRRQDRETRVRQQELLRAAVEEGAPPKPTTPPAKAASVTEPVAEPPQLELRMPGPTPRPVVAVPKVEQPRPQEEQAEYQFPSPELLDAPPERGAALTREELLENARLLETRLRDFGVRGRVVEINPGPVITRYEVEPAVGVKVNQFTSLADDLALVLRARRIRIVAPIPGKAAVGIEIPNPRPATVYLREVIDSPQFQEAESVLTMAMGKTISGEIFTADLATMPHLLIGGSTGSGKSVCLNAIIASILFKAHPSQVQLVLVDPKRLELSAYSRLRDHHVTYLEGLDETVVTNASNAIAVLRSLEVEMERRYRVLNEAGVRNIEEYNQRVKKRQIKGRDGQPARPIEYVVLIIDELADLMLTAAREVEEPIARLTQMSRAVGIHLIVATQRPSVDVITGVIKANFPARIAFQVASKVDSRTIIDQNGAEQLLGRGDMLFLPPASPEPIRLHSAYISTEEITRLIEHIYRQPKVQPKFVLPAWLEEAPGAVGLRGERERDPLFAEAARIVVTHQQGSVSILQRRLKVGYSRAARLIDELEAAGIVGPFEGAKAREVLVDEDGLAEMGLL
ncbi:MAG: DNA translocase FtsK [candidate division KSB1 bacterium]|nr:DNA translocase FtsK [candidate division KSB1 bacterium]